MWEIFSGGKAPYPGTDPLSLSCKVWNKDTGCLNPTTQPAVTKCRKHYCSSNVFPPILSPFLMHL